MDILVVILAAAVTLGILYSIKTEKTSTQLMLLGIEITIIGAVLLLTAFMFDFMLVPYILGLALSVIGLIVNLFGFGKK